MTEIHKPEDLKTAPIVAIMNAGGSLEVTFEQLGEASLTGRGGTLREPTHDECRAHARVALGDGRTGVACWYPQMGGYTAHAVIVLDAGCADVYVWHDGLFPFRGDEHPPVVLHHCDGEQFVQFGHLLQDVMEGKDVAVIRVYVSGEGDAFHSSPDCRDFKAGQQSGEAQGFEVRPIVEMGLDEATAKNKRPCGTCGGTA